jgi:hypothetical protein
MDAMLEKRCGAIKVYSCIQQTARRATGTLTEGFLGSYDMAILCTIVDGDQGQFRCPWSIDVNRRVPVLLQVT